MPLESWKSVFEIGGVILLFLTFLSGAGALYTANRVNAALDKKLRELNLDVAKASEKSARLTKEAEDERMARVELESKVAWRRLDPKAQSEVASQLSKFAKQSALIAVNANDIEASVFASDIAATLHSARWDVAEPWPVLNLPEEPLPFGANPGFSTGVFVCHSEDEASSRAATALVQQLSSRGFDAVIIPPVQITLPPGIHPAPARVLLDVEHKPEGPQGEYKLRAQRQSSQWSVPDSSKSDKLGHQ